MFALVLAAILVAAVQGAQKWAWGILALVVIGGALLSKAGDRINESGRGPAELWFFLIATVLIASSPYWLGGQ